MRRHAPFTDRGREASGTRSTITLFDHELDIGTASFVVQAADVLQSDEGLDDLTRVGDDEGRSRFLAHTSSLKRLRHFLVDPRRRDPLNSEESLLGCAQRLALHCIRHA